MYGRECILKFLRSSSVSDRAMFKAVTHRSLIAEDRVRSREIYGISGYEFPPKYLEIVYQHH